MIIPLEPSPDQEIEITLDGRPYIFHILWNEDYGYYTLSILTVQGVSLVSSIKMVKGFPLLRQHTDSRLPSGELYFIREIGQSIRPGYDDLGTTHKLYYVE